MAVFRHIFSLLLIVSVLKEVTTSTWRMTAFSPATKIATTALAKAPVSCVTPVCPSCPTGYQIYYEQTYQCQYRCLCEISTTPSTTSKPSMSKSLLLSILHNIQNNADALEQMARGLSDEADLAQDAAALSHR